MNIKNTLILLLLSLLVGISGVAVYFYKQTNVLKQDPNTVSQEASEAVIAKVGRLIVLPEGEVPTVATITDPEKLKDQAFFAKAKVGDKVLVYTIAKKAYLYDPVADKLLEVAPLSTGSTPESTAPTTVAPAKTSVPAVKKTTQ